MYFLNCILKKENGSFINDGTIFKIFLDHHHVQCNVPNYRRYSQMWNTHSPYPQRAYTQGKMQVHMCLCVKLKFH